MLLGSLIAGIEKGFTIIEIFMIGSAYGNVITNEVNFFTSGNDFPSTKQEFRIDYTRINHADKLPEKLSPLEQAMETLKQVQDNVGNQEDIKEEVEIKANYAKTGIDHVDALNAQQEISLKTGNKNELDLDERRAYEEKLEAGRRELEKQEELLKAYEEEERRKEEEEESEEATEVTSKTTTTEKTEVTEKSDGSVEVTTETETETEEECIDR